MDRQWKLGCADDAGSGHFHAADVEARRSGQHRSHDLVARGLEEKRGGGGSGRLRGGRRRLAGRYTRRVQSTRGWEGNGSQTLERPKQAIIAHNVQPGSRTHRRSLVVLWLSSQTATHCSPVMTEGAFPHRERGRREPLRVFWPPRSPSTLRVLMMRSSRCHDGQGVRPTLRVLLQWGLECGCRRPAGSRRVVARSGHGTACAACSLVGIEATGGSSEPRMVVQ